MFLNVPSINGTLLLHRQIIFKKLSYCNNSQKYRPDIYPHRLPNSTTFRNYLVSKQMHISNFCFTYDHPILQGDTFHIWHIKTYNWKWQFALHFEGRLTVGHTLGCNIWEFGDAGVKSLFKWNTWIRHTETQKGTCTCVGLGERGHLVIPCRDTARVNPHTMRNVLNDRICV